MGGDDDRRDGSQPDARLRRPGLACAGRLRRNRRLLRGYPDHQRLAAGGRHRARARARLRDRLAARLSRAARAAPLPRLRDARVLDPRLPRLPQRGMVDEWHGRHRRRAPARDLRHLDQAASPLLLFLPVRARLRDAGDARTGALALGSRLRRAAREPDAGAVARRRHAALYADGVRDRLCARRALGRLVRAAGTAWSSRPRLRSPFRSTC